MIYKNIKERQEHKIEILSNKIEELEKDIQQWISFNKDKEHQIYVLENELKDYRKLQNEDDQYWCKHPDENGNKIPMTKVKGSRVMSKEEVEELNKIKLPF
jgi:predicted RNase H-like nuclease (RuvC/YqgF family)